MTVFVFVRIKHLDDDFKNKKARIICIDNEEQGKGIKKVN